MDNLSIKRLQQLHPSVRIHALEAYNEAVRETPEGCHPFITQTVRTFEESDKLYHKGRTISGSIVTNAKAGQSYHNYGLALDFVIQYNGKESWKVDANWMIVVNIFKKHGFAWGGDFKSIPDAPHFEMTFGINWRELLAKHHEGKFIPGNTFVDIS